MAEKRASSGVEVRERAGVLQKEIVQADEKLRRLHKMVEEGVRITTGKTTFRKAYLRSIVDAIEVDDKVVRIHGSEASIEPAVIAGEQIGKGIRSFIRKWRSLGDSNPCFRRERATS